MRRILIVDDDPFILDALGALLKDRYDVVAASNGEEAIERLASEPVDLVVLDMMMPLLDGERVLHDTRGHGARVPIIIVSAKRERLLNFRALGADDFIEKPFDFDVLERKISRLLGSWSGSGSRAKDAAGVVHVC